MFPVSGILKNIVSLGLIIFGLTKEEGMAYATITHSVTSITLILLGAVSLMIVFYGKRYRKKVETVLG